MITEQPFLPLFFNSEDEDLWNKLQSFPTQRRSEIMKHALREFFQAHAELKLALSKDVLVEESEVDKLGGTVEINQPFEVDNRDDTIDRTDGLGKIKRDAPEQVEFSLESLFEMSPVEAKPDPVRNLLAIIGKEEDEEVLRLIRRTYENKEE